MFASWGFYVDTHPRGATERRKTVRSGFPTKDAAERELLRMLEAVETGTYIAPSKLTLERYLPSWLEGKTHLRPSTQETYGILIERYICNPDYGIGTAPLWSLTRPGIRRFYVELERRGRIRGVGPMHPKAVHNIHLVLRKALEDAVEDGLIPANPARRAHKLAVRRPEMKTWTEEQVASFLEHAHGDRLHAMWRTAATTGMRRGEVLALTWPGFDPVARRLHVTQALVKGPRGGPPRFGPPKTDRGRRAVPLDPETVRVLQVHRRRQLQERKAAGEAYQGHGLIFCRPDGRPLDPDVTQRRSSASPLGPGCR
jgi:integrase